MGGALRRSKDGRSMGEKKRIFIVSVWLLMATLLAGCAAWPPWPATGAQSMTTSEAVVSMTPTHSATPAPTRTPRSTATPAPTATPSPWPTATSTRTPRPTATRWVVERLTATAQAAGEPTSTPTQRPAASLVTTRPVPTGKLVLMRASGGEIYTIDADGQNLRALTYGLDPSWSPDGRQVAFTRWDGSGAGVWVIGADGRGERRLYGRNLLKETAWTSDGQRVIFSIQKGGKEASEVCVPPWGCFTIPADPYWRLALVNVADGSYRDVPSDLHSHSPSVAADGQTVVYAGDQGIQSTALDRVDEQIIRREALVSSPAISPDGTHIVYMLYLHDHWDLFVTTSNGLASVQLTRTSALEPRMANYVAPVWSPDGRHIAFFSDRDGAWRLYVMNADGSQQRLFLADELAGIDFAYDFANERMVHWGP
jgi:TolB protein